MKKFLLLVNVLFLVSQISFGKEISGYAFATVKGNDVSNIVNNSSSKNADSKVSAVKERNRVWLNFTNTGGAFKQILVGYVTGATNGWDDLYDGVSLDSNPYVDFYSINSGKNLTIQGRALPFVNTDEVPLGYKTVIEGTFQISIDHVDGVLVNQDIFIKDKTTGVFHNLKNGSFSFTTSVGRFDDRFILVYIDNTVAPPSPITVAPVVTDPVVSVPPTTQDPVVIVPNPPAVTAPVVSEPVVTVPVVVTDPIVPVPVVTDPVVVTDPAPVVVATDPVVAVPVVVDTAPVVTEPVVISNTPIVADTTPVVTEPAIVANPVVISTDSIVPTPVVPEPVAVSDPVVVATDPIVPAPVVTEPVVVSDPVVTAPVVVTAPAPVATESVVVIADPIVPAPVAVEPVVVAEPVVITPVSVEPIEFNSTAANSNNGSFGINNLDINGKTAIVSVNNDQIKVNAIDETIDMVMVYDLKGKLLYEMPSVNSAELVIQNLNSSNQVLLIKTQLKNGQMLVSKTIF